MSRDNYHEVLKVIDEGILGRNAIDPDDEGSMRVWAETLVRDILTALRPQPSREVSGDTSGALTQARTVLSRAESAALVVAAELWRGGDNVDPDGDEIRAALELSAWVLAPWRRSGSRGGRGGREINDYRV